MSRLKLSLVLPTLLLPGLAAAQDVVEDTFTFPAAADDRVGRAGDRLVFEGDGVTGSRELLVDEVDAITGTLVVDENRIVGPEARPGCEAVIAMSVNAVEVGRITIPPAVEEFPVDFELPDGIGGPVFELSLLLAADVPGGCGFLELPNDRSEWTFQDTVQPGENRRPTCEVQSPFECDEGGEVQLVAAAADPDEGDEITVGWDFDNDGEFDDSDEIAPVFPCDVWDGPDTRVIRLHVSDGERDRTCTSQVEVANLPPFTPDPFEPELVAAQDEPYEYCVDAQDPSPLDPVIYRLVQGPAGAALDEDGCFEWVPPPAQLGRHDITVEISDDDGGEIERSWPVTVMENPNTPVAFAGEDVETAPCLVPLCCQGTDPQGLALEYRWELVQVPAEAGNLRIEDVTDDPTAECIDVVVQLSGSYRFDCTVDNGELVSPPDEVWVTIENQPPTCDAGFDSSCFVGERCLLDGRRSGDVNNDPMFFHWAQVSPADRPVGRPPSNRITSFHAQEPGIYCFQLECRDYEFDGEPDEACVVVNQNPRPPDERNPEETPMDHVPVAHCGRPLQKVTVGDDVTLDGLRSYDPDGLFLVNHEWTQVSGPEDVPITGAGDATATVTPMVEGAYVFQLRVQDSPNHELPYAREHWSKGCTTVVQAIALGNLPPVADAGEGVVMRQGGQVTLDGTGSDDPDGDELSFTWRQLGGPRVEMLEAETATPSFGACTPGLYQFELVVNDGLTDSLPTDVWVSIHSRCNEAPVAIAGDDIEGYCADGNLQTADDRIVFDGRQAHDPDEIEGQTGLKYQWLLTGGLPTEVFLKFTRRPFIEATLWDTYTFKMFALDSWDDLENAPEACWKEAWSLPDDLNVVVHCDHNHVPIADAGLEDNEWLVGDTIELDGCGSVDGDGDELEYRWRQTCGPPIEPDNFDTCRPSYPADDTERRCFCLTVDDGWIESLVDCTVHRAIPNNNTEPVCRTDSGTFTVDPGDFFTLDGGGSFDPNGDELEFEWTQTCGDEVALTVSDDGESIRFEAPDLAEGEEELTLCFRLTVSDKRADPVACDVEITVKDSPLVCDAPDPCDCPPAFRPAGADCPCNRPDPCDCPEEDRPPNYQCTCDEADPCDCIARLRPAGTVCEGECSVCTPGAVRECTCRDGRMSNTTCQDDGCDWGECDCQDPGSGGGGDTTKPRGLCSVGVGGSTDTLPGPGSVLLLLGLLGLARRRR